MTATPPLPYRSALIIAGCAGVLTLIYVLASVIAGQPGFPLDDSWIHQVYGRNLATYGQWAFLAGVPSQASTSPLYTVLLAIGYRLGLPYFAWTHGLGAAGLAALGMIGASVAGKFYPSVKGVRLWTGLMMISSWHFVWSAAAGMETVIFCAFVIGCVAAVNAPIGFGVVAGLTILTRPEGLVAVGIVGLCYIASDPESDLKKRLIRAVRWGGLAGVAFSIVIAPYLALNLSLTGTPLPNTSAAKQAENAILLTKPYLERVADMTYPLIAGGQLLVLPGFIVGIGMLIQQSRKSRVAWQAWAFPLWSLALILLYAWRLPTPYQHGRYVIPALTGYFMIACGGVLVLVQRRYRQSLPRILARTTALLALVGFPTFWAIGVTIYTKETGLINGEMVLASHWINHNIPPESGLLATHDIGALGYFTPRPLFDLAGLVTPEIIPYITDFPAVVRQMEVRGVRYLMASDSQLPMPATDRRLCLLYETPGEENPAHMKVYRIAWNGPCR
jgi:hypothetical protein